MTLRGISVFTGETVKVTHADGKITGVEASGETGGLPYISPGFLDLQVNGYKGHDYSHVDFSGEDLEKIVGFLAASGTTQHFPTIVTRPRDTILRNLKIITRTLADHPDLSSAVPGIHIEGPFISGEDGPRGAHDKRYVRDPDFGEFREWQEAAGGKIAIVTLAPERKGAIEFIEKASAGGVIVSLGHTGADGETIKQAIQAGARFSTHLGNGSHARIPRLNNYIWEQMAADELYAGIISDGNHLPAAVVKVICRAKGLERLFLVSDVTELGGLQPGIYKWGDLDIEVTPEGRLNLHGTPFLAGAGHLLDWDIPHFMRYSDCSLAEAVTLVTRNPARMAGMPAGYGTLEPGAPANLTLFDFRKNDNSLTVRSTVRGGVTVYDGGT